jgi:hypothetical protein|eukprot:COSAG02_NODE_950_length_15694_cov_34.317794_9_plen_83_part_00
MYRSGRSCANQNIVITRCCVFQVDKAEIMPTVAKDMLATLQKLNESTFSPYRGPGEQNKDIAAACSAAVEKYGGFFGPFVDV